MTTIDYDPDGVMQFRLLPSSELGTRTGSRRVSRTATLDGGAEVYDTGYSAADRTFSLDLLTNGAGAAWVERIVRTYALIRVSCRDGVFTAVPESWANEGRTVKLTLLITEELANYE